MLLAWVGTACGAPDDDRPPPPESAEDTLRQTHLTDYDPSTGDERDQFAVGSCDDGATQSCRVYLPAHNGVQPCFVGRQTCVDSSWGECGNAVLVDANSNDTEIDAHQVTE